MSHNFIIREIEAGHEALIRSFIADQWGSPMSVSKGRILNTVDLPGFLCLEEGKIIGLLTYKIDGADWEIVTLNSLRPNHGLASRLIERVVEKAKSSACNRIWLITTNDNTHAIRFYQKRGFEWVGFYKDSMEVSRKLKPEISEFGEHGIPIKHEIEFEWRIGY